MARAGLELWEGFLTLQSVSGLSPVVRPVLKPQTVVVAETPSTSPFPLSQQLAGGQSRDAHRWRPTGPSPHSSQVLAVQCSLDIIVLTPWEAGMLGAGGRCRRCRRCLVWKEQMGVTKVRVGGHIVVARDAGHLVRLEWVASYALGGVAGRTLLHYEGYLTKISPSQSRAPSPKLGSFIL